MIRWREGTHSPQGSCLYYTLEIIWENKMMISSVSHSDQGLLIYKNNHFIEFDRIIFINICPGHPLSAHCGISSRGICFAPLCEISFVIHLQCLMAQHCKSWPSVQNSSNDLSRWVGDQQCNEIISKLHWKCAAFPTKVVKVPTVLSHKAPTLNDSHCVRNTVGLLVTLNTKQILRIVSHKHQIQFLLLSQIPAQNTTANYFHPNICLCLCPSNFWKMHFFKLFIFLHMTTHLLPKLLNRLIASGSQSL